MNRIKEQIYKDILSKNNPDNMLELINEIIFNAVNDLVFLMKVNEETIFQYAYANKAGYKHANITTSILGLSLQEVLNSSIADRLQKKYEKVVEHKLPITFQDTIVIDDEELIGESILTPVLDNEGKCQYVVCVTRDITEKVREKLILIESQQIYRSLMDHNNDAVCSLNKSGVILQANPSTYTITGYTEKELKNLLLSDLFFPEDVKLIDSLLQDTLDGRTLDHIPCKIIHKSGVTIHVHIKMVPIVVNHEMTGVYSIIRDISEQVKNDEVMKFFAYHDHLTGLPNRSSLKEDLHALVQKARQNSQAFSVMYVDLDRFKFLNDSMGHNIGDLLLKEVAQRLTMIQKENITVYRQSGDEFILIIENVSRSETYRLAEQVLELFIAPFILTTHEFFVSTSIGISMYPTDGLDGETLIKSADTALYRVKERGRGQFQFYSNDMLRGDSQTMLMETCLRKAIKKNEFIIYYQPQVDLYTGDINSFEALLRWNCGILGFISPSDFIPLAEETGLIIPIGEWVIEEVASQLNKWKQKGFTNISIAVNLSGRQFHQPNLVEVIKQTINKNNIHPSQLEIEITEGAMQDTKEAIIILNRLKEIGVQISVDDFGTGYSSLSYLKQFPLNTLKIDQSFVRDVLTDDKDAAITTTIIHLAHSLGFKVVAEGVELEEQAEFLRKAECQKAQGFLFSRPIPASEIEQVFLK